MAQTLKLCPSWVLLCQEVMRPVFPVVEGVHMAVNEMNERSGWMLVIFSSHKSPDERLIRC